jgi:protein SCO1/2
MTPVKALTLGVVGAIAAIAGLVVAQFAFQPKNTRIESGTLLQQPRAIGDFALSDTAGAPFTKAQFENRWSLVFAGFTYCPDICPNTLALLKSVKKELDAGGHPVQVVFVSVDPERDSAAKLDQYVHYFDPAFVGATGSNEELDKLMRSLSLIYAKVPGATPESYTMDHSAALVLVNPQAQVAGYFLPPHRPQALSADLARVVGEAPRS